MYTKTKKHRRVSWAKGFCDWNTSSSCAPRATWHNIRKSRHLFNFSIVFLFYLHLNYYFVPFKLLIARCHKFTTPIIILFYIQRGHHVMYSTLLWGVLVSIQQQVKWYTIYRLYYNNCTYFYISYRVVHQEISRFVLVFT